MDPLDVYRWRKRQEHLRQHLKIIGKEAVGSRREDPRNYQSVNQSVSGKIMEWTVQEATLWHMEEGEMIQ